MLYDKAGAEAFAVQAEDGDSYRGIYLHLNQALFEEGSALPTPAYTAADQPRLRLARLNVQGFAKEGKVVQVYEKHVVEVLDITDRAHMTAIDLAAMALEKFRGVRQDHEVTFAGIAAAAADRKKGWMDGDVSPDFMVDSYRHAMRELHDLRWTDRGSYRDPISHALGHVSELAARCFLTNARDTLGVVVRHLRNVVSVEFTVRQLADSRVRSGWGAIENPTLFEWPTEEVLRRGLLE